MKTEKAITSESAQVVGDAIGQIMIDIFVDVAVSEDKNEENLFLF